MKRSGFLLAPFAPAFAAGVCLVSACVGGPIRAGEPKAELATYEQASGDVWFALTLDPGVEMDPREARDVVVLFDTSASQTGLYREDALTALRVLLSGMGPKDRVKLVALDLKAVDLTDDFVSPTGAQMDIALRKLTARVPLGSTDFEAGMDASIDSFYGDVPRAVVYIGDGMSKANWMSGNRFADIVDRLVAARIPVSSYCIGPHRNMLMLAAIANQTGGILIGDSDADNAPEQAGKSMTYVAHGTVIWPKSTTLPASFSESYPARMPPLRSDRETVLVGSLADRSAGRVEMIAEVNGKDVRLAWDVKPAASSEDYGFLPTLVSNARGDKGLHLPTVGEEGLKETGRMMLAGARDLTKLGGQALASGDRAGARALAEEALRHDPTNPEALAVARAASSDKAASVEEPGLRLVNFQPGFGGAAGGEEDGALLGAFEDDPGGFLIDVTDQERILEEKIQQEAKVALEEARKIMSVAPDDAREDLKLLLDRVERAPLSSEVRTRLRIEIEAGLREASRMSVIVAEERAVAERTRAEALARERILGEIDRKNVKTRQLMARFSSLMDEGRYREAHEDVVEEIREIIPQAPEAEAMSWWARNTEHVLNNEKLREVRHKLFVDALWQVEKAHVPFPDEPPIVYPDAEVWEELSLRRKKYAAVDLANRGPAEQKIFEVLEEETNLEFIETPLSDAIQYLGDLHGIQIVIDTRALDGVGIGSDTPITNTLKGISLRSALRLMLKDLELTYVIKDEVLQITTPEEAEANLVTKVYPVGDLVLPISSQAGANPFLLGGGLGGMGGFGGGLGGMMGGFGGGMMGGFGGMMGGFGMGGFM